MAHPAARDRLWFAQPLRATVKMPAPATRLAWSPDGRSLSYHVRSGEYYGLNGVGRRVWSLLEGGRTVAGVRDALVAEFDVDAERCTADLLRVLSDLAEAELIHVTAEAGAAAR
mgnify:CR=1 FL=1